MFLHGGRSEIRESRKKKREAEDISSAASAVRQRCRKEKEDDVSAIARIASTFILQNTEKYSVFHSAAPHL